MTRQHCSGPASAIIAYLQEHDGHAPLHELRRVAMAVPPRLSYDSATSVILALFHTGAIAWCEPPAHEHPTTEHTAVRLVRD